MRIAEGGLFCGAYNKHEAAFGIIFISYPVQLHVWATHGYLLCLLMMHEAFSPEMGKRSAPGE